MMVDETAWGYDWCDGLLSLGGATSLEAIVAPINLVLEADVKRVVT
jgi:hypothetical protein